MKEKARKQRQKHCQTANAIFRQITPTARDVLTLLDFSLAERVHSGVAYEGWMEWIGVSLDFYNCQDFSAPSTKTVKPAGSSSSTVTSRQGTDLTFQAMGICSSCLGRRKNSNPETARLLYDDPYRTHYGTGGHPPQRQIHQPDPEVQRREREALEGICHAMSDEVIDVFSILPISGGGSANGTGKGQGGEWRPETPDPSGQKYKPSPVSLKQYKMGDEESSPQEMAYRSVRRVPIRTASTSPSNEGNLEAAKAVMG